MKLGLGLGINYRGVGGTVAPVINSLAVENITDTTAQITYSAGPVGATIYFYTSQSATRPDEADFISGASADWSGSHTVTSTPSGVPGPSGLSASTGYYQHAMLDYNGERVFASSVFTTIAPDTTAPVLSDQGFTVLDETSADLVVTTDRDGPLYVLATPIQGTPSAAQMRAGQASTGVAAVYFNNGQAVSEIGEQLISATGLTETAHYAYFMQDIPSGTSYPSNILEAGPFTPADVTAPVVSSVELVATGTTTATLTFNTDTGEGDAHIIVQPTGDAAPNDTAMDAGIVLAITDAGPQSVDITGLTENTGVLGYVRHTDAAGNKSDIVAAPAEAVTESTYALSWTDSNYDTFSSPDGSYNGDKTTPGGTASAYSNAYLDVAVSETITVELIFDTGTTVDDLDVYVSSTTNVRSTAVNIDPSGGGTFQVELTPTSGAPDYSILLRHTTTGVVELTSAQVVTEIIPDNTFLPMYGQSLSLGTDPNGASVITASADATHLMFNGGIRPHYDDTDVSNVNTHAYGDTMTSLVALQEQLRPSDSDYGETLASGIVSGIARKCIISTMGRGAYDIEDLSRDTLAGKYHYNNLVRTVIQAKEKATGTFTVGPLLFKQGEADGAAGTTKAAYKTRSQTLRSDCQRSFRTAALIPDLVLPMLVDQQGIQWSGTTYAEIAVANIELHREDANIICVGPSYWHNFNTAVNDVHLTSTGYREVGELWGAAVEATLDGTGWNPCHISSQPTRSGTTITVPIHVPSGALVKDTTLVASVADDGFTYSGANITAVTIVDDGSSDNAGVIEITIDAAAGGTLGYAYNNGTNQRIGALYGPRGNIRDSSPRESAAGTKLYNWLCTDQWSVT